MIPANVVRILIEFGTSSDPKANAEILEALKPYDSINREHWTAWNAVADAILTEDLIALTRGLTLAENGNGWSGGSVAAAIWTFRQVQKRDPTLAVELANWILPRTRNPWVPFGRQSHGSRSVEEFVRNEQQRAEQISTGISEQQASHLRAKVERQVRKAQRERSARDRNNDIRESFITALNRLTTEEQLRRLAADETYSVEFYPTCIAEAATESVIKSLDEDTRIALWKKLKGKKRGPWRNFKGRLLATFSYSPWDRGKWIRRSRP